MYQTLNQPPNLKNAQENDGSDRYFKPSFIFHFVLSLPAGKRSLSIILRFETFFALMQIIFKCIPYAIIFI